MILVRQLITTTDRNYVKPIFKWLENQFEKISESENDYFKNSVYGQIIFDRCNCEWHLRWSRHNTYEHELVLRFENDNDAILFCLTWDQQG